ncbi:MAG: hypothetical protein M5R40_24410 [Anaerolineae bacterium]|nr:hypothetical protein [Anaerolineae bacterium]
MKMRPAIVSGAFDFRGLQFMPFDLFTAGLDGIGHPLQVIFRDCPREAKQLLAWNALWCGLRECLHKIEHLTLLCIRQPYQKSGDFS